MYNGNKIMKKSKENMYLLFLSLVLIILNLKNLIEINNIIFSLIMLINNN